MIKAYRIYNPSWKSEDPLDKALEEDFYRNAEVVAIVDTPMNNVELAYNKLVYTMPYIDPEQLL